MLITQDNGSYYTLLIQPSGAMYIYGTASGDTPFTSLDGISYQASS